MDMSPLEVSYTLKPPTKALQLPRMSSTKSHVLELKSPHHCNNQKEYYSSLSSALQGMKDRIGKELTEWKEVVGSLEQNKGHSLRKESEHDNGGEEDVEE